MQRSNRTEHLLAELSQVLATYPGDFPDHLIKHPAGLTDAEREEREATAEHEAAHLVAACACPRSNIQSVFIHPTGRTLRGYTGKVQSIEIHEHEQLFVTYAGAEWEVMMNGGSGGEVSDLRDADLILHPDKADIRRKAADFVFEHLGLICCTAAALMATCRTDGRLEGRSLKEIVGWVRQHVTSPA